MLHDWEFYILFKTYLDEKVKLKRIFSFKIRQQMAALDILTNSIVEKLFELIVFLKEPIGLV